MRYLITLTMGTEKDKYGDRISQENPYFQAALLFIRDKMLATFGGYTEVKSSGGWYDRGDVVTENGLQFQALTDEIDSLMEVDKLARSLASYAASALNQASVMYTFTPVTAGFVGPNEA